jgi:hypothetical protein
MGSQHQGGRGDPPEDHFARQQLGHTGNLIKNLRDGAHKFEFVLTNDQGGVQTLLAMLQLMWPNPDRHGGPNGRTPTIEEARAVVQLAVTIVQWGREVKPGYVIVVTSLPIRH